MALRIAFFVPSILVLLLISTLRPTEAVISGGIDENGEVPFIVDISNASDSTPYCGGTFVSRRHIVTSIACVTTPEDPHKNGPPTLLPPEDVKVYVGSIGAHEGQRYEVESICGHPEYNPNVSLTLNNFAVINLKNEVNVNVTYLSTVKPKVGEEVVAAGWEYTDRKRKLTLRVVDKKECKQKWEAGGEISLGLDIESDKVFCAEPVAKDSNVEFGGGGGFAVANHQYVGFLLATKYEDPTISVFVAVGAYKDFIEEIINGK